MTERFSQIIISASIDSFGNAFEFAKELTLTDWAHTKNAESYRLDFLKHENIEYRLSKADEALAKRMSGEIDSATSYMSNSAYKITHENVPDVNGALVIFLHDFFDSPHCYRYTLFSDFWEWICFTIETLEKSKSRFFIKPHPNRAKTTSDVLIALQNRYPNLLMIDSKITNKQLVQAGMACAVTVHGTVAHEMAYLGVPTIGCGDNPHVAFDFCYLAKSKKEYADALLRYFEIDFDKEEMKMQSMIFYYQHNLHATEDEKELLTATRKWFEVSENTAADKMELEETLNNISKLKEFSVFISKLVDNPLQ